MGFLARLLGYATKEEAAGAKLDDPRPWVIPPARNAAALLRFLPVLFPVEAFAYFEGTTEARFSRWLEAHAKQTGGKCQAICSACSESARGRNFSARTVKADLARPLENVGLLNLVSRKNGGMQRTATAVGRIGAFSGRGVPAADRKTSRYEIQEAQA